MRESNSCESSPASRPWTALSALLPFLWEFRARVMLAMALLVFAKLANIAVPLVLKEIVDALDKPQTLLVVPLFFVLAYGALRLA